MTDFDLNAAGGIGRFFVPGSDQSSPTLSVTTKTTLQGPDTVVATRQSSVASSQQPPAVITSLSPAPSASSSSSKHDALGLGLGLGLPLAIAGFSVLVVLLLRERRQRAHAEKKAEDILNANRQTHLSSRDFEPEYSLNGGARELSSTPIPGVELQSHQIYEVGSGN